MDATLHIYVFKDGLLSRFAHDLRIVVPGFSMSLAAGRIQASFEPSSARVEGAVVNERVDPDGISPKDKASIVETICHDILDCPRHGPVTFDGRVTDREVSGTLHMHGRANPHTFPYEYRPGAVVIDTTITPSRWGIVPYKALGGTIRLQDRWRIRLFAPWEQKGGRLADAHARWVGYDAALSLKERASSPRIPRPNL